MDSWPVNHYITGMYTITRPFINTILSHRLQYEQDILIDNIQNVMKKFDADLRTLRHDKQHLDVALKCADLRQVTLFEEYMLLKEFEKRENVYATKVNTKLTEKEEMQDKVGKQKAK